MRYGSRRGGPEPAIQSHLMPGNARMPLIRDALVDQRPIQWRPGHWLDSRDFFNIMMIIPKLVDREERRQAIAEAALDAIAAKGLDGVKLTDIARAAGVTTGAVAHYFPDKDAVLAAALEAVCARLLARIEEADGPPTIDEIAAVLPLDPAEQGQWRVWLAYWGRAPFSENLREIHRQCYLEIETVLTGRLEAFVDTPLDVAQAIISTVDGIGTRITLESDAWPAERQKHLLHTLLDPLFLQHGLNPG